MATLRRRWFWLPVIPVAAAYVWLAFTFSQPEVRMALRTLPVVPFTIWAIFVDDRRPLKAAPVGVRIVGRSLLFLVTVCFALLVLGVGLNWIFDPNRVF